MTRDAAEVPQSPGERELEACRRRSTHTSTLRPRCHQEAPDNEVPQAWAESGACDGLVRSAGSHPRKIALESPWDTSWEEALPPQPGISFSRLPITSLYDPLIGPLQERRSVGRT